MPADLHLDPEALRRAGRAAARIAGALDAATPPLPSAAGPAVERAQQEIRDVVLRVRGELLGTACAVSAAAGRAEEADRSAAAGMRGTGARDADPTPVRRRSMPDRPGAA